MSNYKYILKDKQIIPIDDVIAWGKWFETADRRVALDELPNGYRVSTVFLGLDYNMGMFGTDKPLVFETMVFFGDDGRDFDMDRYETWQEAEAGHARMVKKWKRKHTLKGRQ